MRFVSNKNITDPTINLALEEYIVRHLPGDHIYLLFYINKPSIIIGKNQNTLQEINKAYVEKHDLYVVRRLSGGGAVYHDLGNLNFSFIMNDDGESFHNFEKFTAPVIEALHKLGVNAKLSGRNDLQVEERKISGNAQFSTKGRIFSHGTLLFNSNLENVSSALKANSEKYRSKASKSIRSRVANISEFLPEKMDIETFKQHLLTSLFSKEKEIPYYHLNEKDWENVHKLANERYRTWDWNYGRSPAFNVQQIKRIEGAGTYDIRLQVEEGRIVNASIYGDFFSRGEISELIPKLKEIPYKKSAFQAALNPTDLSYYLGSITKSQFIELLF